MNNTILAAAIIACTASATGAMAQDASAPAAPMMGGAGGHQGAGFQRGPQANAGMPGNDPRMMANQQGYPGTTGGYRGDPGLAGGYQGYPGYQGYSGYQGYPGNQGYYGSQGYPGNQGWPNMMGGSPGWPNMMGGSPGWPGMMGGPQW